LLKTAARGPSVDLKIITQMNVKLGGELWRLKIPLQKLMIVGIDVYHQTDKKYKSITGFVSSLNHEQTRWYSKVCFQQTGQEITDTLKTAFATAIHKYRAENNFLPEKIIIFRDGVSDSQLLPVCEIEINNLKSYFSQDYCPKMAFIVVQKRINTRIFSPKVLITLKKTIFIL
jgi:aubergine